MEAEAEVADVERPALEIHVPAADGESAPRVSELLGRLDSADEQLGEFGRTPKGQRTPAHIRSAGAEMWESSSKAHTIPEPAVDDEHDAGEHDAATRLQAARRGTLARREYNGVRAQGSLLALEHPGSPVADTSLDYHDMSSPTHAISMEAARQRRQVARSEISRLTEQIAAARQQQADAERRQKTKVHSQRELADAQSALVVKEQRLQQRMAQMKRSIEAAEYLFEQSEIVEKERDAALQSFQSRLRAQEVQINKEAEYTAGVAEALREETAASQQVESELNAVKATADAAESEANAALQELEDAKRANEECRAQLKQAVQTEKRTAQARASLQQEIKVRKLQLRQERQEGVVSQQELDRARDRLAQYGSEIDAKIASVERALKRTQAAQDAADQLKCEAEQLAAKSKQVVAKQSSLITAETEDMHKAEEKALRLIKKQAMQLRKEQLALGAAKAVKLPPAGALQPKGRTADALPTISKRRSQTGPHVDEPTKSPKATGCREGEGEAPKQDKPPLGIGAPAGAGSSGKSGDSDAARPMLLLTGPRRNASRRQTDSRRHTRRRMRKQQQQQPQQPQQQQPPAVQTDTLDGTEVHLDRADESQTTAALADHLDDPHVVKTAAGEATMAAVVTEPTTETSVQQETLPVQNSDFTHWGTMQGLAPIDSSLFENVLTAEDRSRSDGVPELLSEGELASIGAHVTQNMAAQLMRHTPSLSFLKILSTSERMQYLRPLTPGDESRVRKANDSRTRASTHTRTRRSQGDARKAHAKLNHSTVKASPGGRSNLVGSASSAAAKDGRPEQATDALPAA